MIGPPRLRTLAASALVLALLSSGCQPAMDPTAKAAKQKVEQLGGTVVIEEGHVVTITLDSTKVQVSDLTSFESLPRLKNLYLNYTSVNDDVFAIVEKLSSLERLELADTQITEKAANEFRKKHPNVSVSGPQV